MKILLIGEYSGFHKELKNALVQLGCEVKLAATTDFWKKYEAADINLGYGSNILTYKARQFFLPWLKLKEFTGYDIVHLVNFYIIPRTPLLNFYFIEFLKNNNNIVTLSGAGDDPFFVKYSTSTMRYSPIPTHEKYDRISKYYMRNTRHLINMNKVCQIVDGIIPIMYEYYSTFCAAGYSEKTSIPIPIPIDIKKIRFFENKINNEKIFFFHGLNRPGFKGTFLIEECFKKLEKKYSSQVKCVIDGRMSFEKYMKYIQQINIAVDQVYSYSLSMNALYSMAQGKVVAGGLEKESSILYQGEMPPGYNLVPDMNSMMKTFESIIEDKESLSEKSYASRNFIAHYHQPAQVAQAYIQYWKSIG